MATRALFADLTQVNLLGAAVSSTMEIQRAHPLSKLERPLIDKQGLGAIFCLFLAALQVERRLFPPCPLPSW